MIVIPFKNEIYRKAYNRNYWRLKYYNDPEFKICVNKRSSDWQKKNSERKKIYNHEHHAKNVEKRKVQNKKWRVSHPVQEKLKSWRNRFKRKLAILEKYSGSPPSCSCCGEKEVDFLTIEHKNGGGTIHRHSKNIYTVYKEILFNPRDDRKYEVLCMNCNWAKGIHGKCPHKSGRNIL